MSKAIFLDRDGVVNRKVPEGDYITRWEEVDFLPGVMEAVRRFNQASFLVVIATNQRGIARNRLIEADLQAIHARMINKFRQAGAIITAIYYCPHEVGVGCGCRKPDPGMLLRAAREHGIDLATSWMVGGTAADIEAGKRASCKTTWIGEIEHRSTAPVIPDVAAASLSEAVEQILAKSSTTPNDNERLPC